MQECWPQQEGIRILNGINRTQRIYLESDQDMTFASQAPILSNCILSVCILSNNDVKLVDWNWLTGRSAKCGSNTIFNSKSLISCKGRQPLEILLSSFEVVIDWIQLRYGLLLPY